MTEPEFPPSAADGIPRRRRRPDISGPLDQGDSWADRVGLNSANGASGLNGAGARAGAGPGGRRPDRLGATSPLSGGMPVTDPTPDEPVPAPVSHWTTLPVEPPVDRPPETAAGADRRPSAGPANGTDPGWTAGGGRPSEPQVDADALAGTHWAAEPRWSPAPAPHADPGGPDGPVWGGAPVAYHGLTRPAEPTSTPEPTWHPEPPRHPEPTWNREPTWSAQPIWTTEPISNPDPGWGPDPLGAPQNAPLAPAEAPVRRTVVDLTALERGQPPAAGPAAAPDPVPAPQPTPQPTPGTRPGPPASAPAPAGLSGAIPLAPPVSRRSGDEARTGALRLAAIVEAAGSPGGATSRRILSTGPISFDAVDPHDRPRAGRPPADGAFPPADPGATGPLRRRSRRGAGDPDQQARGAGGGLGGAGSSADGGVPGNRSGQTPGRAAGAPAPASTGRSGRNLPAAIGVGLLMAVAVVASLLVRKEAFVGLVSAAAVLAIWELATVLTSRRIHIPVIPLAVGALGMLVSAYVAREEGLLVSFTLTAFGVLLWRIIDGVDGATRDVAAAVFTAAYIPFMAGFAIVMLAAPDGARRVLIYIAVTVASDVGGYTVGVIFGRRPMAPTISPKKSWEGFVGSAVLCMTVAVAGVIYLLHGPWTAGLAVGAAAAVTATVGDLSESLLKRDLGVKDMGNLLPGHGGMMDRLDSLLLTAPAVYLLLTLLVPTAVNV